MSTLPDVFNLTSGKYRRKGCFEAAGIVHFTIGMVERACPKRQRSFEVQVSFFAHSGMMDLHCGFQVACPKAAIVC
jgi:hypothetical protein